MTTTEPNLPLDKAYFRVSEVATLVGVAPHVLRYWQAEFRNIRPDKSARGQRIYARKDVERLLLIKDLLRNQGLTIAGARKRLQDLDGEPEGQRPVSGRDARGVRKALCELRVELVRMKAELERLDQLDPGGTPVPSGNEA